MENVIAAFTDLLRIRFERGVVTTEDSNRYTFFAALLTKTALKPHDIVLEYPHPQLPGAKIDTFIPSCEGRPVALDFEDVCATPSGEAISRPLNAGELFEDIRRLEQFEPSTKAERILVFCTDANMAKYFRHPIKGHTFFDLMKGDRLSIDETYLAGKPATFLGALGAELRAEIECRCAESLPLGHELRVYGVYPFASPGVSASLTRR